MRSMTGRVVNLRMGVMSIMVVLLAMACLPAGACADEASGVVRVNGVLLTEVYLFEVLQRLIPFESYHRTVTPDRMVEYRAKAQKKLIEEELFYQHALELSMDVSRASMRQARKDAIGNFGGKKAFRKTLKDSGVKEEEYFNRVRRKLIIEKFENEYITGLAEVSQDEIRQYYEDNKDSYFRPAAWRLSHILISIPPTTPSEEFGEFEERAEKVVAMIRDGEDFAAVAWDHSDDPYRVKGGDLGMVHEGMLEPELERAVAKLDVGQVSVPIRTIYG